MTRDKKPSEEFDRFINEAFDNYIKIDDMLQEAETEEEEVEAYNQLFHLFCISIIRFTEKKHKSKEIPLKDIDKESKLYTTVIAPMVTSLESAGIDITENDIFYCEEALNYINRVRTKGNYSDTPQGQRYKLLAFKKVFGITNNKKAPSVYNGETAIVTKRPYMLNDCSTFKSSLYEFLMSGDKNSKADMELNFTNKAKKNSKDTREFYLMKKSGKYIQPLTVEHIALLIALENVFMTCKDYIQPDGTIFLRKPDLMKLFGENFRGERETVFLDLVRDMSQLIVKVDIIRATKDLNTDKITQKVIGKIEGNLMSFFTMTNKDGDTIYKIEMPFLQELLKRSTRNTLKSIDLLKYTFKQPKKVLIAEYISNIIFYHRNSNGNAPKKIAIRRVLEQLGLYDEYCNMSAKACNEYLIRLKKDIEIACEMIRNVKEVKFTPISKNKMKETSCGFTIYFKAETLQIEA